MSEVAEKKEAKSTISFSDADHWRFGWGEGLYNFDQQHLKFWATFGPCRYQPKTFDVEIAEAVRKIANRATKPIYVAMSGGIDSELIARIMLQEKVPFTPLIARYEKGYNKDDIFYALDFCEKNKLTPEILDIDILKFFQNAIHTPYVVANCSHLLQMHLMRHAATIGGMAVIGVGEQRYSKVGNAVFVPVPAERIAVTHFMQKECVEGVSAFYCYTPEMMLCLLRKAKQRGFEQMSHLAHNIKEDIYREYWPDLVRRPKYSGFENVREERKDAQKKLMNKYGQRVVGVEIPVNDLEQQLSVGKY